MTGSGRDDRPDGDLEILTGLRSGKRSYYPEYVRSAERFEQASVGQATADVIANGEIEQYETDEVSPHEQ